MAALAPHLFKFGNNFGGDPGINQAVIIPPIYISASNTALAAASMPSARLVIIFAPHSYESVAKPVMYSINELNNCGIFANTSIK